MLQQKPELEVVCELSDGLAAVQKAEELNPDLILLDIGLPTLNGIEAARRIRKLVPKAKILFLSQESSADVVREVLSLGALAYVLKAQAGSELLTAVEAVLQGKKFVNGRVVGQDSADGSVRSHPPEVQPSDAPLGAQRTEMARHHEVLFSSDDASLLEGYTRFITAAFQSEKVVVVVATESHHVGIRQALLAQGVDIAAAVEEGRYIPLDVAETLSTFMVNGLPDAVRFLKVAGDLMRTAAEAVNGDYHRVSACGECAPTLWAKGSAEAAIRVEQLWDEVAKTYGIDILCVYPLQSFRSSEDRRLLQEICAGHSAVYAGETI